MTITRKDFLKLGTLGLVAGGAGLALSTVAARRFGDAAIDGYVGQLQPDDSIIGFEHSFF